MESGRQLEPKPAAPGEDNSYDQSYNRPSGFFGRNSGVLPALGHGRIIAMLFNKNDASRSSSSNHGTSSSPSSPQQVESQPVVLLDVNSSMLPAGNVAKHCHLFCCLHLIIFILHYHYRNCDLKQYGIG